jgi:hypothetical protein
MDLVRRDLEPLLKLFLHPLRVYKNIIDQLVLQAECEAIQEGIRTVPLADVHIVRGIDYFPAAKPIEKQKDRSVEPLELIVPENMKDFRARFRRVHEQLAVVPEDTNNLLWQGRVLRLVTPQIAECHEGIIVQNGTVDKVASQDFKWNSLFDESSREAQRVRPVLTCSEQGDIRQL